MARSQQYKFPAPPPPPGPPSANLQVQPQYGYSQMSSHYQQHQNRGSASRGGRGGNHSSRGEVHVTSSYNNHSNHHSNGGYDPRHPLQGQIPAPHIGPQVGPPAQQSYSANHWQSSQHGPQHGPSPPQLQPHMHHPSQISPLPVQSYHTNYTPQTYQQPPYGTQQPQFHAQPPSYGHNIPPQVASHQWQGQPPHNRLPYTSYRSRGGFQHSGRGTYESPPLMGPPIRMGFDNDRGGGQMAQSSNGFPRSHVNHNPTASFSPQPFQGHPPQDYSQVGQRPVNDSKSYYSPVRARGGSSGFKGKSRGEFHQSQHRSRADNRHHQINIQKPNTENQSKTAGIDSVSKKKKKRKTNTLGLTPNIVEHEDIDEEVDDIDEEARLVTLLGADTPQLPSDLEVWLAERKSKFPTKARREVAAQQARLRRDQAHEGKQKKLNNEKNSKKEEGGTKLEKQQRKAEKLRLELEKAERKIQQEISGSKRKRENGDEGDDDRDQVSDDDSDSSSSSDSDDKPETLSSRANSSTRPPPPPKAQLQRHCKYFSTGGICGKKGKCRFLHDQEVRNQALRDKEANGGKMTLAQRLILNDTAKDDLTILKSIKYLKEKGLMSDQLIGSTTYNDELYTKGSENGYDESYGHTSD